MTLDTIAALAVRTLQSTQWTDVGFSTITKQLGTAMWPQLRNFLWQKYSPVVMSKYVNPLARRTLLPVAQKVGKTVGRKYGLPLARKTGRKIWVKAGEPMARRYLPNFFTDNQEVIPEENQGLIPENQGLIPENQGLIPENQGLILENKNVLNPEAVPKNPLQNLLSKTPRAKRKLRKKSAAKLKNQATTMPPNQAVTMPPNQAVTMPPAAVMVNETVAPEQPLVQNELPSARENRSSLGLFGNTGMFGNKTRSNPINVPDQTENILTPTPTPTVTPTPTPTDSRQNLLGRHLGMGILSNRLNK